MASGGSITIRYTETTSSAVADLTGTIWVFNSHIELTQTSFTFNFTSNNTNFTSMSFKRMELGWWKYNDSTVYEQSAEGNWMDEAYRTIEITGGTDVTNTDLIAWLEANATQIQVTNLTGTKWILNSNLGTTTPAGTEYDYGIAHSFNEPYSLNFASNSNNYTQFCFHGLGEGSDTALLYDSTYINSYLSSGGAGYWADEAYRTIEITGGTDATNAIFISWLVTNAIQIEEPEVTDLTGTNWIFNQYIESALPSAKQINFTSNNTNYSSINCVLDHGYALTYNIIYIYQAGAWTTTPPQNVISISSGTDATDADLISWLQANATQVPVTDLTNTKWVIKDNYTATAGYGTYELTIIEITTAEGTTIHEDGGINGYDALYIGYKWDRERGPVFNADSYLFMSQIDSTTKIFTIGGGTDATNPDLIAWLSQNAELQVEPQANSYELTHSLTNLSHGDITIQITPDTGYTYPSNITVTNGTLVSYDSATGVAIISGDDTTIVNAECAEEALINFSITLSGVTSSYQAEANMTWEDFANSSYNTNNDIIVNGNVHYKNRQQDIYRDSAHHHYVTSTDSIIADFTYYAAIGGD